jgi:hypothetical protein
LAIAVTGYVAAVIVTNVQFVLLQRIIRAEWRGRLYRFLTVDDYEKTVSNPVRKAEFSAFSAMVIGGILALAMLAAVVLALAIPPHNPSLDARGTSGITPCTLPACTSVE